ncbi:MAG: hypothetical protein Q9166_003562 [cf. Caloplaca sp. 2 TL-2023]
MDSTLRDVDGFLAPVLNKNSRQGQGESIIDILSSAHFGISPTPDNGQYTERRQQVIKKALDLLQILHDACSTSSKGLNQSFTNQRDQKVIDALLDLVVLEGIYPSVSPGVGVSMQLRVKSALRDEFVTRPLQQDQGGQPQDQELLASIMHCLSPALLSRKGLASSIAARIWVDLIAAVGELAFSPSFAAESRQKYRAIFDDLLDNKPAIHLLPMLTSLLHPSCPGWLRSPLLSHLSIIPLRPDGVKQIISFITGSTFDDTNHIDIQADQSLGPNLSLDALGRASTLLTSVPGTMTSDEYFSALAPQLLDLLDDPATDYKRIGCYIIGLGILGKRRIGAPGTIGWKFFAEPILEALHPAIENCPVPERVLKRAIDRLFALVHFHPNPGLTKRLVVPILLPLWGLRCYAVDHQRTSWADQVYQILTTYMKISVTESQLLLLSNQMLWDGPPLWTFVPGDSGGIEIRKRETPTNDLGNMDELMRRIDDRVEQYSKLLAAAVLTDSQISMIFTHISKRWLHRPQSDPGYGTLDIKDSDPRDPLESLITAKLAHKLLEDYKDGITSSFEGVLQLIEPITSAFVAEEKRNLERQTSDSRPSLRGLGSITDRGSGGEDGESTETLSTALSLLSAILAPSGKSINTSDAALLRSLQESLEYISQASSSLDISITMAASSILVLLQLHLDISEHSKATERSNAVDVHAENRSKHHTALTNLSNELAPVRAQGLSSLNTLITKASPVLNIPSTAILLISLLQDEDEYLYLSAIKTLGLLAANHPKTVVKLLVERYTDPHEDSTLDVRIKVGEALNKTIEHLGQLIVSEVANMVGESMIAVASRRGDRSKTFEKRQRAKRKADKARKAAENAWDGEILGERNDENDEEGRMNDHIAKVLEGWADTGREDDIRIRTSALSILGTAIETNVAGLGATITSTAIDCVLAILKFEKGNGRAILRRAAVLVIMSLVKGLDAANERGIQLGFAFAGENLKEVITILRYVEVADSDEVVIGHIRVVIESLEAWQQKSLQGLSRRQAPHDIRLIPDEIGIAGLAMHPTLRPKIEEID